MDILLVDDEPLARQRLHKLITELGFIVVAEAGNADVAMAAIAKYDPAVVLLDIEMPGTNGLQVAETIAAMDAPPAIIFTTAYDQYALDAFSTQAAGYLLKPVQKAKLEQALTKAAAVNKLQLAAVAERADTESQKNTAPLREHIAVKNHRGLELIAVDSIRYFMADQKYVTLITDQQRLLIDDTLKELETEFSAQFIRVHRNALVAVNYIQGLDRDQQGHYSVRLSGIDDQPAVSRRYSAAIKTRLKRL